MRKLVRRFLDRQLELTTEGKPLARLRPLAVAIDDFFFETPLLTSGPPHIRDAIDVKRWMMIVVFALVPCVLMAIWNTGVQKLVYTSGDPATIDRFIKASHCPLDYVRFMAEAGRWKMALWYGASAFLPVMIISYTVGGLCEVAFACFRRKPIDEGFLVSGLLFALILPPTIPYWMVAVGVAAGIILSKELFGGTGMNIVNPALFCRVLLFFSFPMQMAGDVWVGTNSTVVQRQLLEANKRAGRSSLDGYTQATALSKFNAGFDVCRIHIDAIGANWPGVNRHDVETWSILEPLWAKWALGRGLSIPFGSLPEGSIRSFVTGSPSEGGLGLAAESFEEAWHFAQLKYEQGTMTDWNFFLGNKLGSMGETSTLACLLGAMLLIGTGVGSWRTMAGVFLGAFGVASIFRLATTYLWADGGAWTSAIFGFPAYRHLLVGGLAFGAVFMATDPVSSPVLRLSRWLYGLFIGSLTMVIRTLNPAYSEGVMLAILLGNVVSPMIDHYVAIWYRRGRLAYA